ncbi:protein yls3 [Quercus suber]|uniref:Protein yls3 n=1 Tax=Quercus suber TaxID=58331 RepID=A0AAW0LSC7_QUESU
MEIVIGGALTWCFFNSHVFLLLWLAIQWQMQPKIEECAQQLAILATCLPYVGGQAKAPSLYCCTGLKKVLKDNKKCSCVIIRDRNDPELGLQINVTLALGLPLVCHALAKLFYTWILIHQKLKFSTNWEGVLIKVMVVLLLVLVGVPRVPKVKGLLVKTRMKVVMVKRDGLKWRLLLAGP